MFRLLRYFSLASAGAIIVIVIVILLMIFFRHLSVEDLINVGERQNETLALLIGNNISNQFGPHFNSLKEADKETVLREARTKEISHKLLPMIKGIPVIKIEILNLKGLIIFSTTQGKVGEDRSDRPHFISARDGHLASQLTKLSDGKSLATAADELDVISSYIPFRNDRGNIVGVFEIYSNISMLIDDINKHVLHVFIALLAALSLLYVVLFQVIRRADKTIKHQHIELKSSEQRLVQAQAIGHQGNWTWEIATGEENWSDEQLRIFGYDPQKPPAKLKIFGEAVHPKDRDQVMENVKNTLENNASFNMGFRIVQPNDAIRHVQVLAEVERSKNGRPKQMNGTVQDVTDRRLTESKLAAMQQIETIGQFASSIAHNLNNLLQPVLTTTNLVRDELSKDSENYKRLDRVMAAARSATGLVKQINRYSQPSKSEMELAAAYEVFADAIDLIKSMVTPETKVNIQLDKNIGNVLVSKSELEAVVINLASNAIESMDKQPKILSLFLEEYSPPSQGIISMQGMLPKQYCRFTVADTGCGIHKDQLDKIFEPLYTTKITETGIGLGLSSAKNSIARHGGEIEVSSDLGKGTTFHILLPII
jgi:PAS domain S-box-containing protein